jgi:hypothetical protein
MKTLTRILSLSLLAAPLVPALSAATSVEPAARAVKTDEGKRKKKKKDKKKKEDAVAEPAAAAASESSAKDVPADLAAPEAAATNNGDWCQWLQNDPGLLYQNDKNPWIQSFEIGGRFHYQVASMEGNDTRGRDFNDTYDEYRRLRFETKTDFLGFLTAEVNVNLVDDRRFRDEPFNELKWGYDDFDEVSLLLDVDKMLGTGGPFDDIKLKYGRMKLRITEEVHMSSNELHTIERSAIAEKLGGNASRPTGVTLELDKADWKLVVGTFSAEDDADFLAGWNDGQFYYGSLEWSPDKDFKMVLDYTQNDHDSLSDDALGYGWAAALSAAYDKKEWGFILQAIYGDNGGGISAAIPRRQGDFHGFVVMPWYWIVEDKLQAVLQYQYASSPESQGLQLPARYLRAGHDDPAVDVDNGRGNEHHSLYAGLNWHLCPDRIRLMGGFQLDDLTTRTGEVKAYTWMLALRTAF